MSWSPGTRTDHSETAGLDYCCKLPQLPGNFGEGLQSRVLICTECAAFGW